MTSLVLSRKPGESIRLITPLDTYWLRITHTAPGECTFKIDSGIFTKWVTHRRNETLVIVKDVSATILEVSRGNVRLRFEAPREVHILRTELIKEGDV